jgi:signal transduction histidine kinase
MTDRPSLLLYDRDGEILLVVPRFMQRVGATFVASGVERALAIARAEPIDVLVIGSGMANEDGTRLLREIRNGQPHAQVLVLQDPGGERVPTEFLAEGIGDTLAKPFDIATFPDRITKLLDVMAEMQRRARTQRDADARMQHAERMALLGTLVATVAHEVANPLSVVLSNAALVTEMLDEGGPSSSEDRSFLDTATRDTLASANTIKDYLSRILGFSRCNRGSHKDMDLADTLKTALLFVRRRARDKQVTVHADIVSGWYVPHDTTSIAQAVVNAITNAIDAVEEHGNVWVWVQEDPAHIAVFVDDDGSGLTPGLADRFADAFFTTKDTGTGLGTAVIRQVMHEHCGSVTWTNRASGGVRVRMELPKRPLSIPPVASPSRWSRPV